VKLFVNSAFYLTVMLAPALTGFAPHAQAQDYRGEMMLVAPDGQVLDFYPDSRDVVYSRDMSGRTVLYDRYGNLVATEMPRGQYRQQQASQDSDYYPPAPRGYDGGQGQDYREYRSDDYRNGPGQDDLYTGSVPPNGTIDRGPLDQPLPPPTTGTTVTVRQPNHLIENNAPVRTPINRSRLEIVALQVFLDREGISPGVIDGKMGSNVNKAIAAWQNMTGETLDPNNSEDIMQRLAISGGMAIQDYTISAADAAGPYVASIPTDYAEKAKLESMSFTSTAEALAEKFHMDETYLRELNPGVDFTIPGTIIKVINPGNAKKGSVARILADKNLKQIFAYDELGQLVAAYPATIGSSSTPSPSGTHTVERIALNPGYTYNPKINFTQGENKTILQIPPGPNGPVGTVWIALSKPTYGIHGTPDPSKIGKTNSFGCIRLTNWDATELAKMVRAGVVVEFLE
jgi:lipoprotein-anchoring transpeptidase ErfK/SrfK